MRTTGIAISIGLCAALFLGISVTSPGQRYASGLAGVVEAGFIEAGFIEAGDLAASSTPSAAHLFVIQPGFPGSTADAAPFMKRLAAHVGMGAEIIDLGATYFNIPKEALAALRQRAALRQGAAGETFAIVSLGFYLEHQKKLGMCALLEFLPEEFLVLLAPSSSPSDPAHLAGKSVVGGPLHEKRFLQRIAFAGVDGVDQWKDIPTVKVTRSLRKLARGGYQGTVLHGREYRTLKKLGKLNQLRVLSKSIEFPSALLVACNATKTTRGEENRELSRAPGDDSGAGRRLSEAFRHLQSSTAGKQILTDMGCDGSRPVRSQWLEKLEKRYDEKK